IHADTITLNETTIMVNGNARLATATGNVDADKTTLYAGGDLDIAAAGNIVNKSGAWQATGNATLQARSIDNHASNMLADQVLTVTTSSDGMLDNQAGTL